MIDSNSLLRRINEIISEAVVCEKHTDLIHNLSELVQISINLDSLSILIYSPQSPPTILYDNTNPTCHEGSTLNYITEPYLLNPFYQMTISESPNGIYFLKAIVSEDFWESNHYRTFYQYANLEDEADYIFPLTRESTLAISMGRDKGNPIFSKEDRYILWSMEPIFRLISKKFNAIYTPTDIDSEPALQLNSVKHIDRCFGGLLTSRELDVVSMILLGNTSKQIGRLLNISPDTIKSHRKSIYSKLEISTIGELFSIFYDHTSNTQSEIKNTNLASISYYSRKHMP